MSATTTSLLVKTNANAKSFMTMLCLCGETSTRRLSVAVPTIEQLTQAAAECGWAFVRQVLEHKIEAICPTCQGKETT